MTGGYIRVKRDDKWDNIEVEYLTDEEREEILKNDPKLIKWINMLCHTIVRIEALLKLR